MGLARKNPWDSDLFDGPREDIPRTGKVPKAQRRIRRYTKFAFWSLVPLTALFLITVMALLSKGAQDEEVDPNAASTDLSSRALATQTVKTWLGSDPAPVANGLFVSWDGARRAPAIVAEDSNGKSVGDPVDIHTLTIASGETLMHVEVPVEITSVGPIVAGNPSIFPYVPIQSDSASAWRGSISPVGTNQDAIELSVQSWADAYFSGDPDKLRQEVGDPNSQHSYIPLSGMDVTATVNEVSALEETDSSAPSKTVIARISLTKVAGAEEEQYEPMDFDVLVSGADTASPRVVAWGGAGTGPSLTKYGNAIVGLDLVKEEEQQATDAPTDPTATGQPTPAQG